jgi:hypothetical protein
MVTQVGRRWRNVQLRQRTYDETKLTLIEIGLDVGENKLAPYFSQGLEERNVSYCDMTVESRNSGTSICGHY